MFKRLQIESQWNFEVYEEGSAVPRLQQQVEFLESLLPIFNTAELLRHRQYIDRLIQDSRERIESEKLCDFMRDRY
jgi:hypothetical protein